VTDCNHITLIKQTGPMDNGLASKRYRCQECNEPHLAEAVVEKVEMVVEDEVISEYERGQRDMVKYLLTLTPEQVQKALADYQLSGLLGGGDDGGKA
jgi:hypothetical protein